MYRMILIGFFRDFEQKWLFDQFLVPFCNFCWQSPSNILKLVLLSVNGYILSSRVANFGTQGCQIHHFPSNFEIIFSIFINFAKCCYEFLVFFINYISQQYLVCISSNRVANCRMQGCQIPHFPTILCIHFGMNPNFTPLGVKKGSKIIHVFVFSERQ